MTTTRTADLWHAAGRAARDDRKRLVALIGVLWSGPVLVLGAFVVHLFSHGVADAFEGLLQPLAYIVAPLRGAYEADHDLALLAYLLWQAFLLCLLWGAFGGMLYRLAAADLSQGRKEEKQSAARFARRHWLGNVGAKLAIASAVIAPMAAAAALALTGRIDGVVGGALLTLAVLVATAFALVAVVIGSVGALAAFLTGPTVACEDSDAFDAVSRTFTYAGAGLPRVVGYRLLFFLGVLLGSGWRALRTTVVIAVAWFCLRVGAGADALDRAGAILAATGPPADADRLGISAMDYVVAAAMALAFGGLAALWCADLVSRVICARTAVYLLLRRAVDGVPVERLRTAPEAHTHQDAAAAGFEEVGRVGEPAP